MKEAKVDEKFAKSALGRKLQRKETRAAMTDFDRYKLMVAKKQKNSIVAKELTALKKKK